MQNVNPCPYCGGEVEIVKLIPKLHDKTDEVYRIECKRCRRLVARGVKFPTETDEEGNERIQQYKAEIARVWDPKSSRYFMQKDSAKERDRQAAKGQFTVDQEPQYEV